VYADRNVALDYRDRDLQFKNKITLDIYTLHTENFESFNVV